MAQSLAQSARPPSTRMTEPVEYLSVVAQATMASATSPAVAMRLKGMVSALAGAPMETTAKPLIDPWSGVLDGSLAQSLGFKPEVRSTFQAIEEGTL